MVGGPALGPRPHARAARAPAGILFAADLILWHYAIPDVGAGLSTVLGNVQVLVVPSSPGCCWASASTARILLALPRVCLGILLISGVLESGAYGENPARGVVFGVLCGLTYAAYILVLRQSGSDLRRPAGPLFDTTAVAAAVAIAARGGDRRPRPRPELARARLAGDARALLAGASAGC